MTAQIRKVLVTGASGLVGSQLVRALTEKRIHVIQLVRKKNDADPCEQLVWNSKLERPLENPSRLEGLDAVIHLSGANLSAHRWTASYKKEILDSRVETTRALSRLFETLRTPPLAFLCASATGIYGNRDAELLREASSPGVGFLADTCVAWEKAADSAKAVVARVVHLRFGVVLTADGGALKQMLTIFRLGLGGRLGSGSQWMSWITMADLTRAVLFSLDQQLEGPVNFTSPNPVTNQEFTRALGEALHRPALIPAPAFALRLAFGEMADEALLASARAIPERLLAAGFRFEHPDIEAALHAALRGVL